MLKPYVHLMRRPGAGAFFAAGIVGRMPISMIGLGIVILIAQEKGSYGLAGAVSGVAVVAGESTATVTTLVWACRIQASAPASSTSFMIQPPCTLP